MLGVFPDGTVGGEKGGQCGHALAYALHPSRGDAACIAGIERRNDFLFQDLIELFRLMGVPGRIRAVFLPTGYSP